MKNPLASGCAEMVTNGRTENVHRRDISQNSPVTSRTMQNTPTELYRDAIAMCAADKLPHSAIKQANLLAETGEAFNAAVWAAIRLNEITLRPTGA